MKELYNELCLLEGLLLKTVNDGATCAALNDLIKERGESVVRGVQELLAAIEMAEETAVAQEMKAPVEDMSAAEEAAAMAVAAAAMPPQINDEEMNEEVAQNEPLNPVRLTPPAMPENTSADAYYTEEEEDFGKPNVSNRYARAARSATRFTAVSTKRTRRARMTGVWRASTLTSASSP